MQSHPSSSLVDRASSAAARLRGELPWLLGVTAGLVVLVVTGRAFEALPHPMGNDWAHSFELVIQTMRGHGLRASFDAPRSAMYAWLLASFAAGRGVQAAAVLAASASACCVVCSTGVAVRLLAGTWAAGVAALGVAALPVLLVSVHWLDHYPLLAGATSVSLALVAAFLRWPRVWSLIPMACVAGLALSVDPRGLLLVVCGAAAILGVESGRPWRPLARLLLYGLVVFGCTILPPRGTHGPSLSTAAMLQNVRSYSEHHACTGGSPGPALEPSGGVDARSGPASFDYFSACTVSIVARGLADVRAEGNLPPPAFLFALPLLLLPDPRGGRRRLASILVFLLPLVALVAGASIALFKSSYLLQYALPLVALVPVALDRLARFLGARWGATGWPAPVAGLLVVAVLLVWPGLEAQRVSALLQRQADPRFARIVSLRDVLQPLGPEHDCSGRMVAALWHPPGGLSWDGEVQAPGDALACFQGAWSRSSAPARVLASPLEGWEASQLEQAGWQREAEIDCMAGAPPLIRWVRWE